MSLLTKVRAKIQIERGQEFDEAIVARLAGFPEERVLDWFWFMVRGGANRLWLLLQLTHVTIQRPASWNPAAVREAHEAEAGTPSTAITRRCFACESGERLYRHHVVEVHHGGSNAPRNQVPLCFTCHQYLHPWLKDEPHKPSRAGWESFADVVDRLKPEEHLREKQPEEW